VAYTRVSTDDQADSGAGIAAQDTAIREFVQYRHWPVVAAFTDTASGAKAFSSRDGGAQALALLDSGQADALVCARLDRLSRNLHDLTATLAHAKAHGWAVVLLDVQVDTTTLCGELMVNLLGAVAQFERGRISENTRNAMRAKKGTLRPDGSKWRAGRPPEIAPETRARILAERQAGRTFTEIARGLDAEQVPTVRGGKWAAMTVRHVVEAANS
jgi:DNA invertase Pin-like site-specific DNA recombinase